MKNRKETGPLHRTASLTAAERRQCWERFRRPLGRVRQVSPEDVLQIRRVLTGPAFVALMHQAIPSLSVYFSDREILEVYDILCETWMDQARYGRVGSA